MTELFAAIAKRPSGASAPVRPRPAPQGGGEIAPTLGPGANLCYCSSRLAKPALKTRKAPPCLTS